MPRATHLTLVEAEDEKTAPSPEHGEGSPYYIRLSVFANGERFPLLFSRTTGAPVPEVTLYAVKILRPTNHAYRTLERHLSAIQFLLCFGWSEHVDVLARVRDGEFLSVAELDRLSSAASRLLSSLTQPKCSPRHSIRINSRERARAASGRADPRVALETASVRLNFCRKFLERASLTREAELIGRGPLRATYAEARTAFLGQLKARIAAASGSRSRTREAPPPEVIQKLLELAHPNSPQNPWHSQRVRIRNYVLVRWLIDTGLRIGEVLNVRVEDVDFGRQEVRIIRRPDSRNDPRRRQPNVKTHGRPMPLMDLGADTKRYVLETRRAIPNATRHPFLFVDTRCGRPLSAGAAEKAVSQLSARTGFDGSITPHLLRHAWNEALSQQMNAEGIDAQTEKEIRSYLMGWDDDSEAAATYTRRHTREQAAQVLQRMNDGLMRGRSFRPW